MGLARNLFKGDRVIWVVLMILSAISLVEVFSAMSILAYKHDNYWSPMLKHIQMLFGGLAVVLLVQNIPSRYFSIGILMLPISIGLLIYTFFWGVEINGSKRWVEIFGITFQPSELAKLACIIFIAFCLSNRKRFTDAKMFQCILIGVIPACGLIFPENFSTSAILYLFTFVMMFIGQISPKRLGGLFIVSALAATLFFTSLFMLQDKFVEKYDILIKIKHRTESFFEPKAELDPKTYKITNDNRQYSYAQIAIANGGIGKFPGLGEQRNSLPLAHADFIYAIIIEEMGVAGGIIVILLYVILLFRVGIIARKCEKLFPKYLVLGSGLLIGIQAFANMAVVVGRLPVTGQPLPLISQGGTSTIITCVYIGMILSVSRFGAGIGNEDDEDEEEDDEDTDSGITEVDTDISEENPISAVETVTKY